MSGQTPDAAGASPAGGRAVDVGSARSTDARTVTIVFLVYNRKDELRTSLRKMLFESGYEADLLDVIVVDNASSDGSGSMVADEFPSVRVITRDENVGVSGWNDGFAIATGDYVLALDDDCYLPADGLGRAVSAAESHGADLVSFGVSSSSKTEHRFDLDYRTGLLSFWGCAVLMRRAVVERLGGYDPGIFVWANELEFMLRFFDEGFRHLHMPELVAVHMKDISGKWSDFYSSRSYRINARHFTYTAAKLLSPRDAVEVLVARLSYHVRDAVRIDYAALKAIPSCLAGFVHGLRRRRPVRNRELSRVYRRNFESFASPWWISRPPGELARQLPGEVVRALLRAPAPPRPSGRRDQYYAERRRYHPSTAATLEF
jgi:GT2 family glycosyltransferase